MDRLVVRNGLIADGTGAAAYRGDLLVEDGQIVAAGGHVGSNAGSAVIDADGLVVAPGFVDVHTHYDAQLMWDPAATPSVLHGVTTVLGGNCGFSVAPLDADAAGYLVPMLAEVEGMPVAALREGLVPDWTTFAGYLDRLDEALVVNAGFSVGHSTVRRIVMGEAAVGELATAAQVDEMARLVHESIAAGALGFTTSKGEGHLDHNGDPVPSRHASIGEVLALCAAAGEHPGTSLEIVPTLDGVYSPAVQMLMVAMSLAARRPVNWNMLSLEQDDEQRASRLAASDIAAQAGGKVVALAPCVPVGSRQCLESPVIWSSMPGWGEVMNLPLPERLEAFRKPDVRERLRAGTRTVTRRWGDIENYTIVDVQDPALAGLVGRRVGDVAAERGRDPFDVLCDVAVADGLRTGFMAPVAAVDDEGWRRRVELCRDKRVVIGASDAGAHVDMLSTFAMFTTFLREAVRDRQLLGWEEAVHLITQVPAALYGLRDRGVIRPGAHADLVIFDPTAIGSGPVRPRDDLPAGASRLYADAEGISAVIVNGAVAVQDGALTGRSAGATIRSGRDTVTPSMSLQS
jgi:N-acyl-D-aspartate/D-glutamate deacylase